MSTTTDTTTQTPAEPTAEPATVLESDKPTDDKAGRDAAKYRRQLRETETERDGLLERVEGLRRSAVERIAGDVIAKPGALWAAGVNLGDLLTAEGEIDADAVRAAATTASIDLGLERMHLAPVIPTQGTTPEMSIPTMNWSDALQVRMDD